MAARENFLVNAVLGFFVFATFCFWLASSQFYARWGGVPPVPTEAGATVSALGDRSFFYRSAAMGLQTLGDGGGRVTPLKEYDYAALGRWFSLLHVFDPASDYVPMMAAYYFGGTRVPRDVAFVVDYLAVAGHSPVGEKWRWLAHAVFLARHRMYDLDRALDLAYTLSRLQPFSAELPVWARQMPAFVLAEQGDLAAARQLVEQILLGSGNFHPNEINFMGSYLIEQLGVPADEVEKLLKLRGAQADQSKH